MVGKHDYYPEKALALFLFHFRAVSAEPNSRSSWPPLSPDLHQMWWNTQQALVLTDPVPFMCWGSQRGRDLRSGSLLGFTPK